MKIIRYSKKYNNIFNLKKDFFKNNYLHLQDRLKINRFYKKQKKRKFCKNCERSISKPFIKNFLIGYGICKHCGHLNGEYQDTKKFTEWLYSSSDGKNYAKAYLDNFGSRVKNIYLPKAEFLKKVLKRKIRILDIGSGGGHFLKALELKKINGVGLEPNRILTELGNKKLKKNKLLNIDLDDSYEFVTRQKNFNTVSLIAVLEHLEKPNELLKAFNKSQAKYLYLALPLFSLGIFLENNFTNVFPRQLSGGHTHLCTEKSISYLAKKNKLKIVGEWWFGQDMPDLYRSLLMSKNILDKKIYQKELNDNLFKVINELQHVLDKNKICSQVHIIFKKI